MGLQDFNTGNESEEEDKKASDGFCPRCETKGEETEHWYYRCTTPSDDCPVITFIPPTMSEENKEDSIEQDIEDIFEEP